jgi:uncharacterized protein (DUF305 family)
VVTNLETRSDETVTTGAAGPRRFGLVVVVMAVVAGLLAGFAAAMLVLRPPAAPDDASPEAGFARDMTAHHAQAVSMGTLAMVQAETQEIRGLGLDISLKQQYEIGMMQQWLRDWDLPPTTTGPIMEWMPGGPEMVVDGRMPGMATQEQMAVLREEAEGLEFDLLFLELMIEHHLGGIHMVDAVLELSDHPEVTWLAGTMKRNQQAEISQMLSYQQRLAE